MTKPILDTVLFVVWIAAYLGAVFWIARYRTAKAHALGPTGRSDYRAEKDIGLRLAVLGVGILLLLLAYAVTRAIG